MEDRTERSGGALPMEDGAVLKRFAPFANNLPIRLSSFIGRERAMTELTGLLSTTRFLTLTGAGGSGKTRLALQVAANFLADFEHGVWWVEFAALTDPLLVPQQVASSLGLSERSGRPLIDTLSDALQTRQLLLVLDNCEHLIAACAQLIETLLCSCAALHILTTSREAFNIPGETIWPVPSLDVPDAYHLPPAEGLVRYEAVQLFIERAASVLPLFRLTQNNAPALVQICRRLDGLPLAIELAAARVKVLSLEQIAARLDDSYRLLSGGSRTALPRQQTLQATLDWSHHLLPEKERILFRRLSVFLGGFTLEDAEAVCAGEGIDQGEVLDLLSHLVDKSLVTVADRSGEARYRLLETIRQYALDKLCEVGEEQLIRQCHRDWFLALAEKAAPESLGKQQVWWYNCLEREQDNLRAALRWSIDRNDDQPSARLGAALWRFWFLRGHLNEGRHWLEQVLAPLSARTTRLRAEVLHAVGGLAGLQGDPTRAYTLLEESIGICRTLKDTQGMAYAQVSLSFLAHNQGDYERAAACGQECLSLLRQLGDKRAIALTLSNLAMTVLYQGDEGRALALSEESLTLYREVGQIRGIASSLVNLAMLRLSRGDYERASTLCQESLVLRQELGDKSGRAQTLALLGRVALAQGEHEQALALCQESLSLHQELGDRGGVVEVLEGLAEVAGARGFLEVAVRLHGAVEAFRETLGTAVSPVDHRLSARSVEAVRSQLPETVFLDQWLAGRAMSWEQAVEVARQFIVQEQAMSPSRSPEGEVSYNALISPPSEKRFGLTAREVEVLRLLIQGLTCAQIAERLIISPRTADAHLRSIYGKLGVTSRAAATRFALEHKLV